jgi:hypothetical protein
MYQIFDAHHTGINVPKFWPREMSDQNAPRDRTAWGSGECTQPLNSGWILFLQPCVITENSNFLGIFGNFGAAGTNVPNFWRRKISPKFWRDREKVPKFWPREMSDQNAPRDRTAWGSGECIHAVYSGCVLFLQYKIIKYSIRENYNFLRISVMK